MINRELFTSLIAKCKNIHDLLNWQEERVLYGLSLVRQKNTSSWMVKTYIHPETNIGNTAAGWGEILGITNTNFISRASIYGMDDSGVCDIRCFHKGRIGPRGFNF